MATSRLKALVQCSPSAARKRQAKCKIPLDQNLAPSPPFRASTVATTSARLTQRQTRQTSCNWQSLPPARWTARARRTRRQNKRSCGAQIFVEPPPLVAPPTRRFAVPKEKAKERTRSPATQRNRCACKQSAARMDSRHNTPRKIKRHAPAACAAPEQTRSTPQKSAPAR